VHWQACGGTAGGGPLNTGRNIRKATRAYQRRRLGKGLAGQTSGAANERVIKDQGRHAIMVGSDKVRGGSGEQSERGKMKSYPFDAALLRMTDDVDQLRRDVLRLFDHGDKIASETAFQTLLSDANRQLASLLQDVRAVQDDPYSTMGRREG